MLNEGIARRLVCTLFEVVGRMQRKVRCTNSSANELMDSITWMKTDCQIKKCLIPKRLIPFDFTCTLCYHADTCEYGLANLMTTCAFTKAISLVCMKIYANMAQETEIQNIFDNAPIHHFPDRSIQWLFEDKENVNGLLEIVACEHVGQLDFNQLTPHKRDAISNTLQEQQADLVFSVPFHSDSESGEQIVYILIEHQSTVDTIMGFRILSYMTQIWNAQRREWRTNGVPKSQQRFYPIIPIILYTGEQKWNLPVDLKTEMLIQNKFSEHVPTFEILFLNVKEAEKSILTATDHLIGWLLFVLQMEKADKDTFSSALLETIPHINVLSKEQRQLRERSIIYLLALILHRRPKDEHEELIVLLKQHIHETDIEPWVYSMAKNLIEQGQIQTKQEDIIKVLESRFESVPESVANEIKSIQNLSTLDTLFDKALAVKTLDKLDLRSTRIRKKTK